MKPLESGDPSVVGSYRVLGRLGEGGMGCVYLGRTAGGRTVALKVVRPELVADAEFRARFRREVALARRVGGRWTAPVLDADTESPEPWVASGYVAGPALSETVARFGAMPEHGLRALVAGLAEALVAVHGLELIHRDIKPSNVLLTLDGPVLIDFGIARALDSAATSSLTASGVVVGSPGYMSPEQVLGQPLGAASDVFQLGTVLAFAATGQGPFQADSDAALLYKVAHGEPELGALRGDLRTLAESCLAKDPADRPAPQQIVALLAPQGTATLVGAGWLSPPVIEQIGRRSVELLNLDAAPVPPEPVPPTPTVPAMPPAVPGTLGTAGTPEGAAPSPSPRRRRRAVIAIAGVLALAGAAAAVVALLPPSKPDGIPAAFLGHWRGETSPGSAVSDQITLDIFGAKDGTGGNSHDISGHDNLTEGSTGQSGLCETVYKQQQVTDRKVTLVRDIPPGGGGDGDWCANLLGRSTVVLSLADDGSVSMSWDDQHGGTVKAELRVVFRPKK
ncbi:serine/threonine-protein kinase [Kitasatospora sp. NPDC096128]|uniref:serine/threonine-protein kinase n=1 Tax=Kitasatospora sp. NPDC096128 TaxID=3155547 RepID=UPI003323A991